MEHEPAAVNSLMRNPRKTPVYIQFEKHLWKTLRTSNPWSATSRRSADA